MASARSSHGASGAAAGRGQEGLHAVHVAVGAAVGLQLRPGAVVTLHAALLVLPPEPSGDDRLGLREQPGRAGNPGGGGAGRREQDEGVLVAGLGVIDRTPGGVDGTEPATELAVGEGPGQQFDAGRGEPLGAGPSAQGGQAEDVGHAGGDPQLVRPPGFHDTVVVEPAEALSRHQRRLGEVEQPVELGRSPRIVTRCRRTTCVTWYAPGTPPGVCCALGIVTHLRLGLRRYRSRRVSARLVRRGDHRDPRYGLEVVLVLGLSLGKSGVDALVDLIDRLTQPTALGSQTAVLNGTYVQDRQWLDFIYQVVGQAEGFVAPALALFLLARSPAGRGFGIGFDRLRLGREAVLGAGFAALIGIPGLGLVYTAHRFGFNTQLVASGLPDVWYRIPILIDLGPAERDVRGNHRDGLSAHPPGPAGLVAGTFRPDRRRPARQLPPLPGLRWLRGQRRDGPASSAGGSPGPSGCCRC